MFRVDLAWLLSLEFYQKLLHDRPRRSPRHYHLLYFFLIYDTTTVLQSASSGDRYLS